MNMILILGGHMYWFEWGFLIFHEMACLLPLTFNTLFAVSFLPTLITLEVLMLSESFSALTVTNMPFVMMKLLK